MLSAMTEPSDQVDHITAEWERIHPDADVDTLSVSLRLIRAGRILQAHLDGVASAHGFAVPGDYEVLAALRRSHPEPMRPTELAARHMITTSAMTGRLDRLEEAGLIRRRPHPHDRRATAIDITEQGIAAADRVFADRLASESTLFQEFTSSEQRTLGDLLRTLLTQLGDQLPSQRGRPTTAT
jgi:DNA-binding MarR family transcriptional regulator